MTDHEEVNYAARCLLAMASGGQFEFGSEPMESHVPAPCVSRSSGFDLHQRHNQHHHNVSSTSSEMAAERDEKANQFQSATVERDSHFMIARILTDLTRLRQDPVKLDAHHDDQTTSGSTRVPKNRRPSCTKNRHIDDHQDAGNSSFVHCFSNGGGSWVLEDAFQIS